MITTWRTAQDLLKREEVLGGFDADNTSPSGVCAGGGRHGYTMSILIARVEARRPESAVALRYGAYGLSSTPRSRRALSGDALYFRYRHIRGGQEMGRHWYEDGKLEEKKHFH